MGAASRRKRLKRQERRELPKLLARVARSILPQHFAPNCCVNGTRIAVEVLRRFDIEARPVATRAVAFNRVAWAHATGRPSPKGEAYILDVGSGDATGPGWDKHLVCVAGGYFLDMSIGQFHRPERGIHQPWPAMAFKKSPAELEAFLTGEGNSVVASDHGAAIVYEPHLSDTSYRWLPGWELHEGNALVADLVFDAMKSV